MAELTEGDVVILTATRALEDQLVRDAFPLVNVRGRSNYECRDFNPVTKDRWSCEDGDDKDCKHYGQPSCTYQARVEEAKRSKVKLTNYQYWMNARQHNAAALELNGNRPIKMLISRSATWHYPSPQQFLVCLRLQLRPALLRAGGDTRGPRQDARDLGVCH